MKVLYAVNSDCKGVKDFIDAGNEHPKTYMWWDYINPDPRYQLVFIENKKGGKIIQFIEKLFFLRNLQYQIDVIRRQNEYDAIFCSLDHFHIIVALCRLLRILKKPIFGLSHYSFNYKISTEKWLWKLRWKIYSYITIKGFDYLAFLSDKLLEKSLELNNLPLKSRNVIEWGVDLDFYDQFVDDVIISNEPYFMSIGSSNRDYKLLVDAFKENSYKLNVFQKFNFFSTKDYQIPPNVFFDEDSVSSKSLKRHQDIRKLYKESYAVLIPLEQQFDNLTGITVLVEALACGKAVVITDNVLLPFDVEEEGIGFKVKYGDKQGWIDAVNYLVTHPAETRIMGEKAYEFVKIKYNYNNYKEKLLKEFTKFSESLQII
tara:strand:- start:19769 stop:20887 length:1119 start_codon:yes stop_codon:yes gene_type:complete